LKSIIPGAEAPLFRQIMLNEKKILKATSIEFGAMTLLP